MKTTARGWILAVLGTAGLLAGIANGAEQGTNQGEAAPVAAASGTNRLSMNFKGAPLDQVLDYLSEAAGFIINKQAEIRGSVEIWSKEPVTKDEAVQLLNSALRKNGYTALRSGRLLTIVSADTAKSSDLEVVQGGDPETVEKSDEIVTQVIPVRFANATQLVGNLQPLLPASATLSVNESANSLVLVATRTQIKRTLRIISALDNSMARASSVKVILLRHADARQLAASIQQLFQPQTTSSQNSGGPGFGPQTFNFPGGFPGQPGLPGGPGQSTPSATTTGTASGPGTGSAAGSRVVAVADETSNSLIISAAADILAGIVDMVGKIDVAVSALTEVRAFRLRNADPTELAEELGQLFPDTPRSSSGQGDSPPMFGGDGGPLPAGFPGGGGPPGFGGGSTDQGAGTRSAKAARVLAVAEPRTRSLLVSASSALMPQIVGLVERLDSGTAGKETVKVFDLNNADPTRVRQVLQDLFNRNLVARSSQSASQNNNNTDPLLTRETQQQQTGAGYGNNSGFGSGRGIGGSGSGSGSSSSP